MLCPEVCNFPSPKIYSSYKKSEEVKPINKFIELNNFYRSVILTCPDELNTPEYLEEALEDCDYYKISDCSLTEFLNPVFVKSFVKSGSLFCLTPHRNSVIQNCACITPDGVLTLHLLEFIYQTLGLEGKKVPHNFYQVKIDLHNLNNITKIKSALNKLETFDIYVSWEPQSENICPSSIAKYFSDRNIPIATKSLELKRVTPDVNQIPSIIDAEIDEVVEWIGMLTHNADISPTEGYISMYSEPESTSPIQSKRLSLLIVKGFLSPIVITRLCNAMYEYAQIREIENYWMCLSIQSMEDSLWRWNISSPSIFQSQNNSSNIFFTKKELIMYSIGQLKYS